MTQIRGIGITEGKGKQHVSGGCKTGEKGGVGGQPSKAEKKENGKIGERLVCNL